MLAQLKLPIRRSHEPELPLIRWMHGFATPNFHFHLTTAYAICRQKGAPLGKADFFAGGLGTL